MGFAFINAAAVVGFEALSVRVEADISSGLPKFHVVGLPDAAVSEAKERVRSAIKNSGFSFPRTVITINLSPAHVKKQGPSYDLAIAMGILTANEVIKNTAALDKTMFLGELALDGALRPIRGALLCALLAKRLGYESMVVPEENANEALLVEGLKVHPIQSLAELVGHLKKGTALPLATRSAAPSAIPLDHLNDFAAIKGQEHAKRALEIAAAGGHNILLCGSPGSGKTLLAKALASILPPLNFEDALEVTAIYSVAGLLRTGSTLIQHRPFRAAHHSASGVSLVGGGSNPRPGEISLAHRGVLFLDELPEFNRVALENLRQPLEEGTVTISRATGSITFPARFILAAAMNPCACGYAFDEEKNCTCSPQARSRYRQRISGPLLDRIDLTIDVPRLPIEKLQSLAPSESSAQIRNRVTLAREVAAQRYLSQGIKTNAELGSVLTQKYCALEQEDAAFLAEAAESLKLSARSYMRTLKVARTIADLSGSDKIELSHLSEALQYRSLLTKDS